MTAPLGYEALCGLARELGRPQSTLTVLSHGSDPFGIGTPAHRAHAEWFARLWHQHMPTRGGHLRRLHYRLAVDTAALTPMVDGAPYENTTNCWSTLKRAGKWARYLGLVDADDFDDKRPLHSRYFFRGEDEPPDLWLATPEYARPGFHITEPTLPALPRLSLSRPTVAQRYHLEVWAEKTTVDDVVEPIAGRFAFNYLAFAGQPGIKPCRELVDRAVRHGRPVRILYISDFDPQGESMPVAVARKIEFVVAERGLDLDIRLIPIVLTAQQCVDLKLPRAPIKDGDRGRSTFEERHGEGATELDALEALHPGLLHDLLVAEVERYHDATLNERVDERFEELSDEAQQLAADVVPRFDGDLAALRDELADLRKQLDPIRKQLEPIREKAEAWAERVEVLWKAIGEELNDAAPDLDAIEWPEPTEAEERPDPLFDSRRSYVDQISAYKAHQRKPTEKRQRSDKGKARKLSGRGS